MIAVGVGIAPMIQAFHELFRLNSDGTPQDETEICLLYGVRTVADILLKEQIEEWANLFSHRFRVVYCVGSRWAGVHMAAKVNEFTEKFHFSTHSPSPSLSPVAQGRVHPSPTPSGI